MTDSSAPSQAEPLGSERANRRREWIEVAVVLCLAVVPDFVNAVMSLTLEDGGAYTPVSTSVLMLTRSLQVAVPTLFIISRTPEGFAGFGFGRIRPWSALGIGMFLGVVDVLVSAFIFGFLQGISPKTTEGATTTQWWTALYQGATPVVRGLTMLSFLANSFAEELVTRAFLITRFEKLFRGTWPAIAVSSVFFASYHVYQGPAGAVTALVFALIFGYAYARLRRLGPLVVGHTLVNLVYSGFFA